MTRSLSPLFTVLPMPRALSTVVASIILGLASMLAWGAPGAPKILVFGDSLAAAYGIAERRGWVALLEERLKRERLDYSVVNASVSGETSAGGRTRLGAALAAHKPAVVVLELGANDGLRGLPVAAMRDNLAAMIEQAKKAGARVLLVGMRLPPNYGPDYVKSFETVYPELAKKHGTALTPFLLEGMGEKLELFQPDRIHPTEAAQPAILETVWKGLAPLLKANPR